MSAVGHPVLDTPTLDALAASGTLFANHWANAAPCGPSRACLYTGTYLHHHRSVQNGTPLDARFTNVALLARQVGYDPVLFGYTDTSVDPRTLAADDLQLTTYEGVLPGFRAVVHDPFEAGSREWGTWLEGKGVDVPVDPHRLYLPIEGFHGSDEHGSTWAPARFTAEHSETAFMVEQVTDWLKKHGSDPFFLHASFIRPHPPRRNPAGYHDLYVADDLPPFVATDTREEEAGAHPFNQVVMNLPFVGAPDDERERRQMRATYYGAQREVDDQLARLFGYLDQSGLSDSTLVVLTSDHGDMAGDHWLFEKLGYWDESYHVPLIVKDPERSAAANRGRVVHAFTESVDVMPTICEWLGIDRPAQADGYSLLPFVAGRPTPEQWRREAHWSWDFSNPATRLAEEYLGLPMAHCTLDVVRGHDVKYVQFAADGDVLAPLLFDMSSDPGQFHDLVRLGEANDRGWDEAQRLLRWRMRNDERTLSGHLLTSEGMVVARDEWR
jgi:arylsulfatase A-like enzyme